MEVQVREHPVKDLPTLYDGLPDGVAPGPFTTPAWLAPWMDTLGRDAKPLLLVVEGEEGPVGVAPLRVDGHTARLLGSFDVCDYQDFTVVPGAEAAVARAVASHLARKGLRVCDLGCLLPDASALAGFRQWGRSGGPSSVLIQDGWTAEASLPETWAGYLGGLSRRNRHEFRRKERRLAREGGVDYRVETRAVGEALDGFLDLFVRSRPDKAAFLTPGREAWFRALAPSLARAGALRIGVLEVGGRLAATTFGFVHRQSAYLYNNGFDPVFEDLSVGILSKGWAVRSALEEGCRRYSFLKGDEPYKLRLGATAVPLVRLQVELP